MDKNPLTKVRLQTALDIFELEEWQMEAFGIRTPSEFENYKEKRKQLYDKCKSIEKLEYEKIIRKACSLIFAHVKLSGNISTNEVIEEILNK